MLVAKTFKSWAIVSGGWESGDGSVIQTALRELAEEVGWHLSPTSPLLVRGGESFREDALGTRRAKDYERSTFGTICVRLDNDSYLQWYNLVRLENLEHNGTVVTEEVRALMWVPINTAISRNFKERYGTRMPSLQYFLKRLNNPASSDSKDLPQQENSEQDSLEGEEAAETPRADDAETAKTDTRISQSAPQKLEKRVFPSIATAQQTKTDNLYTLYISTVTVKGRPSLFYIRRDMEDVDAAMNGSNWPQFWEVPQIVVEGTVELTLSKLGLKHYDVLFVDEAEKVIAIAADHANVLSKWNPPLPLLRSARGSVSQEIIGFGLFFPFAKYILERPGVPDDWLTFLLRPSKHVTPFFEHPSQQERFSEMMVKCYDEWLNEKENSTFKLIFNGRGKPDARTLLTLTPVASTVLFSFLERFSPLEFVHRQLLKVGTWDKIHPAVTAILEAAKKRLSGDSPSSSSSAPSTSSTSP